MESDALEDWLSEFIERREGGEELAPEDFARHKGGGAELLAALRALVATEALFPSGAPDLPVRIGPYRVRAEIGRGGMGRVLEVVDPARPGTTLALKLLHVSLGDQPRALERFRREGQALERLEHPWIVRVHAAGLIDARPFLAMEKVEGTSLAEHLERARARRAAGAPSALEALALPGEGTQLERACRLVARAARAMAAAHREGVLHRDLNPRNVLVRTNGEPVVIDFGLMRASDAPTLTGSGDLLGTPQYMAPEQARGERVDERSDVFGLGAILRELVTLAPPRTADDTLSLVRQASSRPLPRLNTPDALPRELHTILARATSFFPRWRYASCAALAADLELLLEGEPIRARAPGLPQRALEGLHVHRRAAFVCAALALAALVGLLARRYQSAEELHQQRIQATNAVLRPWLDGDLGGARTALARLVASEKEPPFVEFLRALALDELTLEARDPASRALLVGERARRAGRAAEARAAFDTAWDLTPGYPLVVLLQGMAALAAGDPQAARGKLEASAFDFGRSARMHRLLVELYEALALPADAARARNAALALERSLTPAGR